MNDIRCNVTSVGPWKSCSARLVANLGPKSHFHALFFHCDCHINPSWAFPFLILKAGASNCMAMRLSFSYIRYMLCSMDLDPFVYQANPVKKSGEYHIMSSEIWLAAANV